MSFKQVYHVFTESNQNELPIVDSGLLQGVIIKEQLLGKEDNDEAIATIKEQFREASVKEDERIIVALKKMTLGGISNLPVVDIEGNIKGIVSASTLWNEFSIKSSMSGIGGWIVLSMNKNDFKLSEIAQIVESNGMMIVMHFVHFFQEMDIIDVHVKVSRENVNELVQTFQRYGYKVVDVIQPKKFADDWDNRFDELMRFFST
jgi:predicted transcriptional regulator